MNRCNSIRYPALIDGTKGAYGVSFPDLPGIVAMGKTIEEAIANAQAALRDYMIETESDGEEAIQPGRIEQIRTEPGQILTTVPFIIQP